MMAGGHGTKHSEIERHYGAFAHFVRFGGRIRLAHTLA